MQLRQGDRDTSRTAERAARIGASRVSVEAVPGIELVGSESAVYPFCLSNTQLECQPGALWDCLVSENSINQYPGASRSARTVSGLQHASLLDSRHVITIDGK